MKLKFIITIFLAIILSDFSIASFYKRGDTLNVWATSGLNMRKGPGTDFPKIRTIGYGDKVEVIDQYLFSTPLDITVVKKSKKSDEFVLKGFWVKVKNGKKEGYVFDAYLSRLPVLNLKKIDDSGLDSWESENLIDYIEREIGFIENKSDSIHLEYIINTKKAKKWIYKKEIQSKDYNSKTTLEDISFQEGFLFFNILHRFEEVRRIIKLRPEQNNWRGRNVEIINGKIHFLFGNDNWEATLFEEKGKLIFSEGYGC